MSLRVQVVLRYGFRYPKRPQSPYIKWVLGPLGCRFKISSDGFEGFVSTQRLNVGVA